MADEAGFLLVKGDMGLGNRILCLLSALLLARITGRRAIVDWRDPIYSSDGRNAFPHLLASDLAAPLEELPDTDSVRPAIWRGHLHESAVTMRRRIGRAGGEPHPFFWERLSVDLSRVDHPERVLVVTSYFEQIEPLRRHLSGDLAPLRALPLAALLRRVWCAHLDLAPALQRRVDEAWRTQLAPRALGVHVRASDRRARVAAIEAAVTRSLRRDPDARIFLATDNAAVLRRYRERFPGVAATDKWYPPAGAAMHLHAARPDALGGARDALVDLALLTRCDRLVVDSRSSFGRLALVRSDADPGGVVDVHPGRLVPMGVRRELLRASGTARNWLRRVRDAMPGRSARRS